MTYKDAIHHIYVVLVNTTGLYMDTYTITVTSTTYCCYYWKQKIFRWINVKCRCVCNVNIVRPIKKKQKFQLYVRLLKATIVADYTKLSPRL
jgi:hypothetical protein